LQDSVDPDEQAEKFIHLIDDLSYAKTFYPQSKTTQFINGLAAKQFQLIYQNQKRDASRLITFWKYELPLLFGKYHRIYLFTTLFFILCVIIGVVASKYDPRVLENILGEDYVSMTEDNIQKGDPFGVYKEQNEFGMFVNIAANNIRFALMTYITGLLACLGSLYMLFATGLMLGSFQYFFFAKGLGWASVLVIWIHGTLEISAIVIAGTAGMVLGYSFLFPGTFDRIESLKRGAKDSVKIIIGTIPFFLLAAFFEGFVTRHTHMPVVVSITILMLSACCIIWYFIIYPILLNRVGVQIIDKKVVVPSKNGSK
jgi:uncharacterized membrane protein SpoIIM required for sporulation